nr:PREDICTED: uncharacterized protein LOC109032344 isoform X2 [Bemisia tabaci]
MVSIAYKAQTLTISFVKGKSLSLPIQSKLWDFAFTCIYLRSVRIHGWILKNFVYLSQPIYRRRYLQKKCQEQERELQPGNSSNNRLVPGLIPQLVHG